MISLIIPVFNEKEAIEETLKVAHETFSRIGEDFEILVINDGSTDGTGDVLKAIHLPQVTVINRPENRGYGAAMKMGLRMVRGDVVAIVDADGTYPIHAFPKLLARMHERNAHMVIGERAHAQIPLLRRPAKCVVRWLVDALMGYRVPDNNSGMRVFRKDMALEFMHLYPQGFSFTITITLAALTSDYIVEFVPIEYYRRKGRSSLSAGLNGMRNFLGFLGLIIRIIMYFRPLRFFAWPSVLLMVTGAAYVAYTIAVDRNVSDAGMLMLMTGLQIGLFGLLAEVVVRHGRARYS